MQTCQYSSITWANPNTVTDKSLVINGRKSQRGTKQKEEEVGGDGRSLQLQKEEVAVWGRWVVVAPRACSMWLVHALVGARWWWGALWRSRALDVVCGAKPRRVRGWAGRGGQDGGWRG
jgi:hypothetical protein